MVNLSKLYQNVSICKILYKNIIFNKYATYLKTTISQKSLRNSIVLLVLIDFNNFFYILIDKMDNIIYSSGPCHQHSQPMAVQTSHVIRTYILHINVLVYF